VGNRRERVGSVEPADRATERPDVPAAEDRWSVAGNIATGRALGEGGSAAAVAASGCLVWWETRRSSGRWSRRRWSSETACSCGCRSSAARSVTGHIDKLWGMLYGDLGRSIP